MDNHNTDDGPPRMVAIDHTKIDAARDLIQLALEAAHTDGGYDVAAGMLAFGALFNSCCEALNVPVATGMYVVGQLMTKREPSSAIH